jgi:hypothetical protein
MNDRFATGLLNTLWILRDYLSEIVVGGGWVPFLYYRYLIENGDRERIFTRDIDLMVRPQVPVIGSQTIDKLLREAGLKTVFKSRDTPPLIHYEGEIDGVAVEIEFLTDQSGSNSDSVRKVQPDLHAEALRFISLIVDNTVELTISHKAFGEEGAQLIVKVPTPAAYVFHKGLIYRRRKDQRKRDKDLYYIFDILTGCRKMMPPIMNDFVRLARIHKSWFRTFVNNLGTDFADADSDGVLGVVEQRPANVYQDLDEDQFRNFVYGTFEKFKEELLSSS